MVQLAKDFVQNGIGKVPFSGSSQASEEIYFIRMGRRHLFQEKLCGKPWPHSMTARRAMTTFIDLFDCFHLRYFLSKIRIKKLLKPYLNQVLVFRTLIFQFWLIIERQNPSLLKKNKMGFIIFNISQ